MSHLTDGEIHVHLDGALDLLPEHRVAEVREHLSRCEDCQARLEEERRIREQASEILEGAAAGAPATDPPSFESIRERAAGSASAPTGSDASPVSDSAGRGEPSTRSPKSSARSRESWYRGLAWAATIVLSLGIGWYARSGVVETEVRSRPTLTAPSGPVGAEAASSSPAAPVASELARTAENATRSGGDAGGPPGRQVSAEPDAPAEAPAATPEAGGREPTDEARVAARADGVDRTDQAAARVSPTSFTGDDGAMQVQGSLAVPGLPVLSVAWDGGDGDDGGQAVTVVQRLPSGDPLTLRYTALAAATPGPTSRQALGADVDRAPAPEAEPLDQAPQDAGPTPPDSGPLTLRPVSLRHGPWILEATAPLQRDSVQALLDRLPPQP